MTVPQTQKPVCLADGFLLMVDESILYGRFE